MATYMVHMLAFCYKPEVGGGATVVRPVRIPNGKDFENRQLLLEGIFYYGQNDFCTDRMLTQTTPSVSVGDVIEFEDGEFWQVAPAGFKQISEEQFRELVEKLPTLE